MDERIDILKAKLETLKAEYEEKKNSFLSMIECEINTSTFEKNAISDLTEMLSFKTKIRTIEETIYLLKTRESN